MTLFARACFDLLQEVPNASPGALAHFARNLRPPGSHTAPGASPRAHGGQFPQGFSLTELLVVIAIIVLLMGLVGAAVSAARANQKSENTRRFISKIDAIVSEQMARYDSMSDAAAGFDVSLAPSPATRGAYRAWFIRRNWISSDLPDRWSDVVFMAQQAAKPNTDSTKSWSPRSASQRTYVAIMTDAIARNKQPTDTFAGAECLFMIVMMGGIADCLDCGDLKQAAIGDKDGDGFNEFHDEWGNPIGFILWPCGVELPAGSGTPFFFGSRALDADPFSGYPRPTLGMRPLIYSAGSDEEYGFDRRGEVSTLSASTGNKPLFGVGTDCGNHQSTTFANSAGASLVNGVDVRGDNVTNLDEEARQ